LRGALNAPSLGFEEAPTIVGSGGQAIVYALSLADPHNETKWGSVPLVCKVPRRGLEGSDLVTPASSDIRNVAAFQEALADLDYPAPRVVAAGTHLDGLGVPFLVMERVKGKPAAVYLVLIIHLPSVGVPPIAGVHIPYVCPP